MLPSQFGKYAAAAVLLACGCLYAATPSQETDQTFLRKAGEINLAEIELGKLAETRATNPVVRSLGQQLRAGHKQNLEASLTPLAEKDGVALPSKLSSADEQLKDKLEKISGAQFEHQYVEAMIGGHKQAIGFFEKAIKTAKSPAVKSYAEKTLPMLQKHLSLALNAQSAIGIAEPVSTSAPEYRPEKMR